MRFRTVFLLGIALVSAMPCVACAWDYSIKDLGMPEGYSSVKGFDINDNGFVVGRASNGAVGDAFLWDSVSHGFTLLNSLGGNSTAWSINNDGAIVGASNTQATLWSDSQAAAYHLGTLGGPTSTAFKINDHGMITGWADLPDNQYLGNVYHGFVAENKVMQDIGTFTTDYDYYANGWSLAWGINNFGNVTGTAMENDYSYSAFLRNVDGVLVNLGKNPAYPGDQTNAVVINDLGLIGGNSVDVNGNSHPLIWASGQTLGSTVAMPAEYPYGEFYGVNEKGEMVGVMWNDAGSEHAFLYKVNTGTVSDLNDLISSDLGWELQYARGINEKGQIVGFGLLNGQTRGFVLKTVPEPVSSILFLLGSATFGMRKLRRRNKARA